MIIKLLLFQTLTFLQITLELKKGKFNIFFLRCSWFKTDCSCPEILKLIVAQLITSDSHTHFKQPYAFLIFFF